MRPTSYYQCCTRHRSCPAAGCARWPIALRPAAHRPWRVEGGICRFSQPGSTPISPGCEPNPTRSFPHRASQSRRSSPWQLPTASRTPPAATTPRPSTDPVHLSSALHGEPDECISLHCKRAWLRRRRPPREEICASLVHNLADWRLAAPCSRLAARRPQPLVPVQPPRRSLSWPDPERTSLSLSTLDQQIAVASRSQEATSVPGRQLDLLCRSPPPRSVAASHS